MKHIEETNRIDQAEQQLKLKMRVRALTKDLVEAKIKLKDMGAPEGTPKGGFGRITQQRRRPQSAGPQRRRYVTATSLPFPKHLVAQHAVLAQ